MPPFLKLRFFFANFQEILKKTVLLFLLSSVFLKIGFTRSTYLYYSEAFPYQPLSPPFFVENRFFVSFHETIKKNPLFSFILFFWKLGLQRSIPKFSPSAAHKIIGETKFQWSSSSLVFCWTFLHISRYVNKQYTSLWLWTNQSIV